MASLRRKVRWLTILCVVLLALLAVGAAMLVQSWIATGVLRIPIFDCFT